MKSCDCGRSFEHSGSCRVFNPVQDAKIRQQYDEGFSTLYLAEKYGTSTATPVERAIRRTGGRLRSRTEARQMRPRRYHWNPAREVVLWSAYRITFQDCLFLYRCQGGLCLWCKKPLSLENILLSYVDHAGGKRTRKQRHAVRGLCCSNPACNYLAGRIEKNLDAVKNILDVLSHEHFPLKGVLCNGD